MLLQLVTVRRLADPAAALAQRETCERLERDLLHAFKHGYIDPERVVHHIKHFDTFMAKICTHHPPKGVNPADVFANSEALLSKLRDLGEQAIAERTAHPPQTEKRGLSVAAVAVRLGVTRATVCSYIRKGVLEAGRVSPYAGKYWITEKAVRDFERRLVGVVNEMVRNKQNRAARGSTAASRSK